jgi:hypothetical protein
MVLRSSFEEPCTARGSADVITLIKDSVYKDLSLSIGEALQKRSSVSVSKVHYQN